MIASNDKDRMIAIAQIAIDMETWTADWSGGGRARVKWEADNSTNFLLCLLKPDWLLLFCRATITNQALVDRKRTFILLSVSHSTLSLTDVEIGLKSQEIDQS